MNISGRSPAKIKADKKADEKRKNAPRIPGCRLTKEQGELMDKLYKKCKGNDKKESILTATRYYIKNN